MKKNLLSLTVGMLVAISGMAAPTTFNVPTPKWTKLVVSKSENGVNIRKSPSTSAPKLVYKDFYYTDAYGPLIDYTFWSTAPTRGKLIAYTFTGPAPVYSENAGWVEVKGIGAKGEENGWVSKSVCNLVSPTPLKYNDRNSEYFTWIPGGNESDGYYAIDFDLDEMDGIATFSIGRLVNGILVCTYAISGDYTFDPNQNFKITPDGSGFKINFCKSVMINEYTPSVSLLTDTMIKEIISKAVKIDPFVIYEYNGNLTSFQF